MIIVIDQTSPVPPYEQLRQQVTTMIEAGTLPDRHRLPSVRQLASDLDLANGTVARAYRELETAGMVATNGRHGTVVRRRRVSAADQRARLRDAAEAYVLVVRHLGASTEQAIAALAAAGLSTEPG